MTRTLDEFLGALMAAQQWADVQFNNAQLDSHGWRLTDAIAGTWRAPASSLPRSDLSTPRHWRRGIGDPHHGLHRTDGRSQPVRTAGAAGGRAPVPLHLLLRPGSDRPGCSAGARATRDRHYRHARPPG